MAEVTDVPVSGDGSGGVVDRCDEVVDSLVGDVETLDGETGVGDEGGPESVEVGTQVLDQDEVHEVADSIVCSVSVERVGAGVQLLT
ncbi:MAG: hypothetical protein ACC654_05780 [Acidimicrobiia bacterium]